MAENYRPLAQVDPLAATLTDAYTVPALTKTVVSSIIICNRSVATSFRISIAVAGAVNANKQYLFFDAPIAANETKEAVIGITLATTDVIRVYTTLATLSFNIFGVEIT